MYDYFNFGHVRIGVHLRIIERARFFAIEPFSIFKFIMDD